MGRHRYQPQGAARLDRRNKFAAGAQAILSAAHNVNLATGKPLTIGLSGYQKQGFPVGLAWSFRKNFYVETEVLPALGTASFVEFWIGYPRTAGTQGADTVPAFVTGSNLNKTGIFAFRGTGFDSAGGNANSWGAVYDWDNGSKLNSAEDFLTAGVLTKLMIVRRQTGMEMWRDGILIRTIMQSPVNYPAQTLICGAFIEDKFWTTDNDTVMAGRVLTPVEPTADEIRQFFTNHNQIFADPHDDYSVDELRMYTMTASPGSFSAVGLPARLIAARNLAAAAGTFAAAGAPARLLASRKLAATGGAYALDGAAARLLAGRRVIAGASAYALSGAAAALRAARRMAAAPGAFTLSSAGMQMVYTPAPGAAGPTYVLGAAPGSFGLTATPAALRAGRRLAAGAGSFGSAGAAAGLRAARRLRADAGSFSVVGSAVVLKYSSSAGPIDISKVAPARIVVFEGSGSRVVAFEGSGSRVVRFE